jgi:L-gulonolactone oxidase
VPGASHRHFEFYWFPHTETVQIKSWDATEAPALPAGMQRYITEVLLENTVFGALCKIAKAFPASCPALGRFIGGSLDTTSRVDDNYSVLSTVRSVKFNEMEWALPADRGLDALREIKDFVNKTRVQTMFPIEVRWVRGDDIWISPHYGRDSIAISVHQYQGMPYDAYFDAVQAIARNHSGRPHWGKIHGLRGKDFEALYPRWQDFLALRERMDPQGTMLTPYLRALFGLQHSRDAADLARAA